MGLAQLGGGAIERRAVLDVRRVAQDAGDDVPATMQGVAGLRPYYTVMFVVTLLQVAATLAGLAV